MSPSRSRLRLLAAAIAIGFTVALNPAVASAEIVVSDDGILYTHEISGLLESGMLVPLDTATDSFSIRSETSTPGYLRIVLTDVTSSDPALLDALTVAIAMPGAAGANVPLTAAKPCVQLLTAVPLNPGQAVTVNTSVAMEDLSGLVGQSATFSFRLRVVLSDEMQDSNACVGASGADSGVLSNTGGVIPVLAVSVSVAAIVTGATVVVGTRRKRTNA